MKTKFNGNVIRRRNRYALPIIVAVLTVLLAVGFMDKDNREAEGLIPVSERLSVHVIDIGQGDSTLISHGGHNILIDAGPDISQEKLRRYLDSVGIKEIDCFIATHPHEDHIGGGDMILENYSVKLLLMTDLEAYTYSFERILDCIERYEVPAEIPAVGDEYTFGEIKIKILGPLEVSDNANNMSLCLKISYGETDFMFTGDGEAEAELALVRRYGEELDCDFLKVGHHGSSTSSTVEFLSAVSPEIATISCEAGNSYGHPHREIPPRLRRAGVSSILRTDELGDIVIYSDGENIFLK